jgi:hypothetical protein
MSVKIEINKINPKSNTIKEPSELKQLACELRESYESLAGLTKAVREKSREALAEAILCGQKLKRTKELVGPGGWVRWLQENCPQISRQTALKWMKLGSRNLQILSTSYGLRQAYIALGIIDEDKPRTPKPTAGRKLNTPPTVKTSFSSGNDSRPFLEPAANPAG